MATLCLPLEDYDTYRDWIRAPRPAPRDLVVDGRLGGWLPLRAEVHHVPAPGWLEVELIPWVEPTPARPR